MIDNRDLIRAIANSTPEECRELGKLFLAMADAPRDLHWKASFREKLASMPAPPDQTREGIVATARARITAENDELWRQGWHPTQMRRELEARGYTGIAAPAEQPA